MKRLSPSHAALTLLDAGIAAAVFMAAAILFIVTRCPFADAGTPARRVAVAAALYPDVSLQSPLWRALASWVAMWTRDGAALRIHVLNALLVAAAVGLLYLCVRAAVYGACRCRSAFRPQAAIASRFAGLVAALAAATATPLWWAATRAHDDGVGLLLVVACAGLLVLYMRHARTWQLALPAAVCGVAAAEWTPAIFTLPFFAGAALLRLIVASRRPWRGAAIAAVCACAGLSVYVIVAACVAGSEGGALRGVPSIGAALLARVREQVRFMRFSMRETGWLITVGATIVPFCLALGFGRDALSELKSEDYHRRARGWSFPFLHLAMTVIVGAALANTRVAPWTAPHAASRFLLPAVLSAAVLGYLAAYWYLLPYGWWPTSSNPRRRRVRAIARPLLALFVVGGAVALAVRSYTRLDRRSAVWVQAYATAVVDSLNGQTWLVSDGFADDSVRLVANEREMPLVILNLREARHPVYRHYVTAMMERAHRRNAAELGVDLLVREMVRTEADARLRIATTTIPGVWREGGLIPVPRGLVFTGADREATRAMLDDLVDLHCRLRKRVVATAGTDAPPRRTAREQRFEAGVRARMEAMGRYLAQFADTQEAADLASRVRALDRNASEAREAPVVSKTPSEALPAMYMTARDLDPDAGDADATPRAAELVREARFATRWGDTVRAAALLDEAEDAGVPAFHIELERAVMYARAGDAEQARVHAKRSLEHNADFLAAWVILAGIHEMRSDRAGMERVLAELEARQAPDAFTATVRSRLAMQDGDMATAAQHLDDALLARPNDPHLLQQQALTRLALGQDSRVDELVVRLLRSDPDNAVGHHIRGRRQVADGELALAEQSLRHSVGSAPAPRALNDLAWVLHKRGKQDEALRYAQRAADDDPEMPSAWHTLGTVQLALGDANAAVDAFRTCLRLRPEHDDARRQLNAIEDALETVEE